MTEQLQEILNRKPSKWGNLTVKEFERDIKLLQESVGELEKENERYEKSINDALKELHLSNVCGNESVKAACNILKGESQ